MLACSPVNVPARLRLPPPSREFVCRAAFVGLLVIAVHQLRFQLLRFLTSEAVLRISSALGITTQRISFDTIRVHSQLVSFVVSCTFIDVVVGTIALLWDYKKPRFKEAFRMALFVLILLAFNLTRLEVAQILYSLGVPWILADEVLGGIAYFAVWIFIWRHRTWDLTSSAHLVSPN